MAAYRVWRNGIVGDKAAAWRKAVGAADSNGSENEISNNRKSSVSSSGISMAISDKTWHHSVMAAWHQAAWKQHQAAAKA